MTHEPDAPKVTVGVADGVAAVTLHNRTQRNALTKEMCLELQRLMPRLDADSAVEVITIRGAGATFSAGASLTELESVLLDKQPDGSRVDQLSAADRAVTSVAKPTIALVDGECMGGGWQLASACDFIVASERSVFAITPAKLGVIYPRAGVDRLVRLVGAANAKFLLFTAQSLTAPHAHALGLVAAVFSDEDFDVQCTALIGSLRSRSRFTIHTLKRLIDLGAGGSDVLSVTCEWTAAWESMVEGPDMEAGISAFLNRKQPLFTWRPEG